MPRPNKQEQNPDPRFTRRQLEQMLQGYIARPSVREAMVHQRLEALGITGASVYGETCFTQEECESVLKAEVHL